MGMGYARLVRGAQIAYDNAGKLPVISGNWYFVNPDATNIGDGRTIDRPFKHFVDAYNACKTGHGDGIAILSNGTTTAEYTSYLTEALTWSKWGITVVGLCAPTRFSQRARISTAADDLAYLIDITGSNNAFYNISLYNGGKTGAGCLKITGGNRNYFNNVHLMGGMGMTTPTANDYSLMLDKASENTFENCTIGTDTFDKGDVVGAELLLDNGCMRNRFENCEFLSYHATGTTAGLVKLIGSDAITRDMVFKDCLFHVYDEAAAAAEAAVVIGDMPDNGIIIMQNCLRAGCTDWAGAANARVYSGSPTMTEAGGIAIVSNPS